MNITRYFLRLFFFSVTSFSLHAMADLDKQALTKELFVYASQGNVDEIKKLEQTYGMSTLAKCSNYQGNTVFHVAALSGQSAVINFLANCVNKRKRWVYLNNINNAGLTPLHCACCVGSKNAVSACLNGGASPVFKDTQGFTPLHFACFYNTYDVAKCLLDGKKIKINTIDKEGNTPLFVAVDQRHVKLAKLLMDNQADPAIGRTKDGLTPVHLACLDDSFNMINSLTEGLNEEQRRRLLSVVAGPQLFSPLHFTAYNGRTKMTQKLLDLGVDWFARTSGGQTALHVALTEGKMNVAHVLCNVQNLDPDARDADELTPLHIAAVRGDVPMIDKLLLRGASLDPQDKDGRTPLMGALLSKKIAAAQLLLQRGACRDITLGDGLTPLFIAVVFGDKDMFEMLCKNGFNANEAGEAKVTPFLSACAGTNVEMINYLGNRSDVDIHACNAYGSNAAMIAVANHAYDSLDAVLKLGVDPTVEAQTSNCTALHYAVVHQDLPGLKIFANNGVKFDVCTSEGAGLFVATCVNKDCPDVWEFIQQQGADVNQCTNNGVTPIQGGIRAKNYRLVSWLLQHGAKLTGRELPEARNDNRMVKLLKNHLEAQKKSASDAGNKMRCEVMLNILQPYRKSLESLKKIDRATRTSNVGLENRAKKLGMSAQELIDRIGQG